MKACRTAYTETLLECARADRDIVVVTTDARGSVQLNRFADELPDQFIEVGIAEQNAVGIAAGLANGGKHVFVSGPASFYCARSLEQVKNDIAYTGANVKVAVVSGGVAYGALGSTHHSLHDIAVFRAIPGISVLIPADARQTEAMTRYLAGTNTPAYMRMGRGPVPDVYGKNDSDSAVYCFGKGNVLREGTNATIIACGQMVHPALEAAASLAPEQSIRVIDMPTVAPIDSKLVISAAIETGAIVTVEEHSIHGGLGGAVSEICGQHAPAPLRLLGIPDEHAFVGSQQEIFDHYQLHAAGIAEAVHSVTAQTHMHAHPDENT